MNLGHKFFKWNDLPAKLEDDSFFPLVLRGGGWETAYDSAKFVYEAERLEEDEFNSLVASFGGEPVPQEAPAAQEKGTALKPPRTKPSSF